MNDVAKKKTAAKTIQRSFDIAEYSEKARIALLKLKNEQQPGQQATGGKSDVLKAVKDDIKKLLEEGYTEKQIADAFTADVFGILPKTITEIVSGKKRAVSKRAPKTQQETPHESGNKELKSKTNTNTNNQQTGKGMLAEPQDKEF